MVVKGTVSNFTWCLVSLLALHIVGGGIFSWLERDAELAHYERNRDFYHKMREMYEFEHCHEPFYKHMDFCKKQKEFNHQLKEFFERSGNEMKDRGMWTFFGSTFFVSTLVTTLGYGTFHPRTPSGQLFTVVFGLVGIPVMGYVLSQVGGFIIDTWLPMCPVLDMKHRRILVLFGLMVCFILVGGMAFVLLEGWTYIEACYFSACTLMMIGFGDYLPSRDISRLVTMVFIVLGLGVAASLIALLQFGIQIRGEHFASRLNSWYGAVIRDCSGNLTESPRNQAGGEETRL